WPPEAVHAGHGRVLPQGPPPPPVRPPATGTAGPRHSRALLADEHAALRRVATLVAQRPSPEEIFTAVSEAVGTVLGADVTAIIAFPDDVAGVVVARWSCVGAPVTGGTPIPLRIDTATAQIF